MKVSHLIVGLVCPVIAWAQVSDVYTEVEAVRKAESLIKGAHALRAKVDEVCSDANATGLLYEVAENAIRELDSWPDNHQKSQNLAAYDACRQSMVDVQSYAYTCANDGYKGKAATYMQRRWIEDSTGCDSAIRASDLSRKDSN